MLLLEESYSSLYLTDLFFHVRQNARRAWGSAGARRRSSGDRNPAPRSLGLPRPLPFLRAGPHSAQDAWLLPSGEPDACPPRPSGPSGSWTWLGQGESCCTTSISTWSLQPGRGHTLSPGRAAAGQRGSATPGSELAQPCSGALLSPLCPLLPDGPGTMASTTGWAHPRPGAQLCPSRLQGRPQGRPLGATLLDHSSKAP